MGRWLTWVSHQRLTGWACSQCSWSFPVPPLLSDREAKSAYDRLASTKFHDHDCSEYGPPQVLPDTEGFAARARRLVTRGFKPRDAAHITLQEVLFEKRNDPAAVRKAEEEAEDFLRRVKEGLI